MTIKLDLLGYFQMMLGTMHTTLSLPAAATVDDLWEHLVSSHIQLQGDNFRAAAGITVNGTFVHRDSWDRWGLHEGDYVILVSQMAGG